MTKLFICSLLSMFLFVFSVQGHSTFLEQISIFKPGITQYSASKIARLNGCYIEFQYDGVYGVLNKPGYVHFQKDKNDSILESYTGYTMNTCFSSISTDGRLFLMFADDKLYRIDYNFYFHEGTYKDAYAKYLKVVNILDSTYPYKDSSSISTDGVQTGEGVNFYSSCDDMYNDKMRETSVSLDIKHTSASNSEKKETYELDVEIVDMNGTKLTKKSTF